MRGHVFQTFEENPDRSQFKKTLQQLEQYGNMNLKFPDDMVALYEEQKNQLMTRGNSQLRWRRARQRH